MRVDQTGKMRGFGRIDAAVGLAEQASANILVQTRLIDAGYGVKYDSALDQYAVDTDSTPMTFTRKATGGGKRSPHYTHVIERAYVKTAAGNKARFTRREAEESAEAGKNLLSKFAHGSSWKGVTDQVERGIKNLPIAEKGENHLETDGGIHERENQPSVAADSDAGHECEGDSSLRGSISSRHHVRLPDADTPGTINATPADPSARS